MKSISITTIGARPEVEILICCTRARMTTEKADRIRSLLKQEIDWDYLSAMAFRHAVMPLLYYHLKAICPEQIPEQVLLRLREQFHFNTGYNLFLTNELIKLLKLVESHGIEAIPFKGPILARSVYGDIALRQFLDLDILVRKSDVPKISELLSSTGFEPQFDLTREQEASLIEFRCEHAFGTENWMTTVDLHWSIVPTRYTFAPDPEDYWKRIEHISMDGARVPTLSSEDLFLLLCVHGAKHAWKHLNWICDLAELTRTYEQMNWAQMIKQARAAGSERMLFLGILLAYEMLEADVPDDVLRETQTDPIVKPLAAEAGAKLFREVDGRAWFFEEDLFYIKTMKRLRDKARLILDNAVPTPLEWELLSLPSSISLLYYFLRPLRLATKYMQRIIRRED